MMGLSVQAWFGSRSYAKPSRDTIRTRRRPADSRSSRGMEVADGPDAARKQWGPPRRGPSVSEWAGAL